MQAFSGSARIRRQGTANKAGVYEGDIVEIILIGTINPKKGIAAFGGEKGSYKMRTGESACLSRYVCMLPYGVTLQPAPPMEYSL